MKKLFIFFVVLALILPCFSDVIPFPAGRYGRYTFKLTLSAYLPLAGGTMTGNLLLGANGIGNNASVLTFGIGADGTATFGGNVDISGKNLIGDGDTLLDFGTDDTIKLYAGNVLGFQIAEAAGVITNKIYGDLDVAGQVQMSAGAVATPSLLFNDCGLYSGGPNVMRFANNSANIFEFYIGGVRGNGAEGPYIGGGAVESTAVIPIFAFRSYTNFGLGGKPSLGYISLINDGRETQRLQNGVDADSDTDDVLSTGLTGVHGILIVAEGTADESCKYYLSNVTIEKETSDATFTVTKDNAATYNVYYDTTAFMIQNKVGDNKSLKWVFYGFPIF